MDDDTSLYVAEQLLFLGGRLNRTASQLLLSFDFGTENFVVKKKVAKLSSIQFFMEDPYV